MNILLKDYTDTYENIITLRDFTMTVEYPKLNNFIHLHDISHLINEPTCFQSHDPTCIDKILENGKAMFKISKSFESGLWNHHK